MALFQYAGVYTKFFSRLSEVISLADTEISLYIVI